MLAKWGARFRGRGVLCTTSSGATSYRPNKLAAGMTNTLRRHKRGHSDTANTLSVRGTCDKLIGWYWHIETKYVEARCSHCGATHPDTRVRRLSLSVSGKRRLAQLRAMRRRPLAECTCRPSGYHNGHASYCPCKGA